MGAGKTSVGRALAKEIGHKFRDLDRMIVAEEGTSVDEIFATHGQDYFRKLERAALTTAIEKPGKLVLALGGGSLHNQRIVKRLKKTGTLVYLNLTVEEIAERLARSKTRRPLLFDAAGEQLTGSALIQKVERLLRRRRHLYEQAHIVYRPRRSREASARDLRDLLVDVAL